MNTTALVRIRVQATPPLDPLKAWHTFTPDSELQWISELTNNIAQAFGLSDNGDLTLELDGFVLLPSSPIGAVRDGDFIIVKLRHNEKRKADEARASSRASGSQPRKRQKNQSPSPNTAIVQAHNYAHSSASKSATPSSKLPVGSRDKKKIPESSSESSSSGSSDSSDSSTDSDPGSSSSSESESSDSESESKPETTSDSSSSSKSDGPPRPRPILHKPVVSSKPQAKKPTITASPQLPKPPNPLHPPVPPGQGKRSTQDRNSRRRKLQKHRAAGTEIIVPRAQSSTPLLHVTNQNEDSTMAPVTTTTQTKAALPIAPAKNANKNKRRGFDKDMASTVATRVVFGESSSTSLPPPTDPPTRQTTLPIEPSQKTSLYKHYHVVPPSQLSNLPSNVIVTSVDVEAVDGMEGVGEWFDGDAGTRDLGHVTTSSVIVNQSEGDTGQEVNWVAVDNEWEKQWHEFQEVGDEGWKDLKTGTLLAWKALTLDPATCTPCTKIHLARVVGSPDLNSNQIECFIIDRPGSGDIMFGFGGKHIGTEEEPAEQVEEEPGEIRMVGNSEIKQWKVVT